MRFPFKHILIFLSFFFFQKVLAQDPVFTQFYAVPTMTNPSFAGSQGNTRLVSGYRSQWMGSTYNLSTFFVSADKFLNSINSGLGVSLLDQNESLTGYNYLRVDIAYSFHVQISDHWTFFPGFGIAYGLKQFNFNDIILGDQIDIDREIILPGSNDPINSNEHVNFFDISAGGVFYNENAWLGISVKHLTKPDIAFTDQEEALMEIFYSIHGGYKWQMYSAGFNSEESYLFVTANYMKQGAYNRIDLGSEMLISGFSFGFLTSGTLQKIEQDAQWLISVNPLIGLEFKRFKLGVSYDFPIGDYDYLKGTGEFTFQYFIKDSHRRKRVWQVKN